MAPLTEKSPNIQAAPSALDVWKKEHVRLQEANSTGLRQDAKAKAGKKRKSDAQTDESEQVNLDDIEIPDGTPIDWNANQIRNKIRTFINSGEMKVGEFQKACDNGANSYRNFMAQNGPSAGTGSDTFHAAFAFFKKREIAGLKMPQKKRAKTADKGSTTSKKGATKEKEQDKLNVEGITLDGEDKAKVPIFDTCDDIRTKINRHLRESSATQAGFMRALKAQYPESLTPTQGLSTNSLKTFLSNKGPSAGGDSEIFYSAYVYFEKLRVKDNKKKSKKREEMEKIWGARGGMERWNSNKGVLTTADARPSFDQYGQLYLGGRLCH